jgi:hypothetical protein
MSHGKKPLLNLRWTWNCCTVILWNSSLCILLYIVAQLGLHQTGVDSRQNDLFQHWRGLLIRYKYFYFTHLSLKNLRKCKINYLCTFDLYGPVRNVFDACRCTCNLNVPVRNDFWCGQIHYLGKSEGVGPWKLRVFWALWNDIEPIGPTPSHLPK